MVDYRMEVIYGLVDEALKAGPRQSSAASLSFPNDGRKLARHAIAATPIPAKLNR
jgi:hypothetical protein